MINAYLTDTITVSKPTFNKYGEPTGWTDTTPDCKIYNTTKLIQGQEGEEVLSTARILLQDSDIGYDDKVTYQSRKFKILSITEKRHFTQGFTEIFI